MRRLVRFVELMLLAGVLVQTANAAWKPTERWRGFNIIDRIYNDKPEYCYHEDDFRLMKQLGFNFARVPINYRHWIKDGDWNQIDETKFAEYDKVVELGRKYGIHIQLCFHRAPGWCVASWPVEPKNLFRDEETLEVCVKHWRFFAERYKAVPPEVLSFNLFNEPPGGNVMALSRVSKRLIDEIRKISPERFIVVDGIGISRQPIPELLGLPGVGQATRGYLPTDVSLYKASWGAKVAPPPEWPYDPEAPIGNLLGPGKQLEYGKHPLVLNDLPPGTLAVRFGIINGPVTFEVTADGDTVANWYLEPAKDDPLWTDYSISEQWKTASASYAGTKGVKLPKGATRVEISIVNGDWGCVRKIAFRPNGKNAKSAIIPVYVEFGSHINFWQQYDAKSGSFHPEPESGYARRYADNGREYLYRHIFRYWDAPLAKGEFGMIGEFACWKMTPHPIALALIEDYLKLAKERNMGWAMWQFRGDHGIVNSGRADVEYEDIEGFPKYKLDRKMYELLKRY